jgi:hypothetical protein
MLHPNVDKLTANKNKIFVKSPPRIQSIKNKASDTPLAPTPVITHCGIWFHATVYYAQFHDNKPGRDYVSSAAMLQDIFKDSNEMKVLKTGSSPTFMQISVCCRSL